MAETLSVRGRKSFTLIELLITIGIVSILSLIVIITLNPVELLKESRDARRVAELTSINRALNIYVADQPGGSLGTASTTYISIPDPTATSTTQGNACTGLGLPSLPSGYAYHCAASSTYRNTDGTGWLPVNFSAISFTSPLGTAPPIDPINTTSSGEYYTYTPGGSWELTATPESSKTRTTQANQLTGAITLGTDLTLSPLFNKAGLVGYWKFDEGSGTTTQDSSGNGNGGTLTNSPAWTTSGCRVGNCLSFNGSDNFIQLNTGTITAPFTLTGWFNTSDTSIQYQGLYGGRGPSDYAFDSKFKSDNTLACDLGTGSAWEGVACGTSYLGIQQNTWHHFVFVITLSSATFYVDGAIVFSSNSVSPTVLLADTNHNLRIGSSGSLVGEYFKGSLDDFRVYNRALSAAEVMALYNATK